MARAEGAEASQRDIAQTPETSGSSGFYKVYLMLVVLNALVIQDNVLAGHLKTFLCQELLQDHSADDACDWQAPVNCRVEGVKLDIPA